MTNPFQNKETVVFQTIQISQLSQMVASIAMYPKQFD